MHFVDGEFGGSQIFNIEPRIRFRQLLACLSSSNSVHLISWLRHYYEATDIKNVDFCILS